MQAEEKLVNKLGFNRVKLDEPLKDHTYMKVGGPADLYFEAETQKDLLEAVQTAIELGIPCTVLGQGANVLVSDRGVRGLVIVNKTRLIKFLPYDFVEVDSGVNLLELTREAAKRGLGGLELMTRVPATVGGAIFMNAGDTGKKEFIGELVVSITFVDEQGKVKKISKDEANFTYRTSRFQTSGEIVLSAKLQLVRMSAAEIDAKVKDILVRKTHQPAGPSVGSTFRNPEGEHAGELIEKAGLKGKNVGGARISEQHGNFIINVGNARAGDVKELIELMKKTVKEKFNIDLIEEVRYLGDW